jgi:hypothetical protein
MPPHEVAEVEGLHDLAKKADRFFVGERVVEGVHVMAHLDIRYDSTAALSVSESAAL